ncbi:hypothetical protein [Microcystis aeruginosa]|nr:hypothetical protein [Microcystis aeruginosa]
MNWGSGVWGDHCVRVAGGDGEVGCGVWGSGEVGKWGVGEFQLKP